MFSTVDSLVSGTAFTVHNDLLGGPKGILGKKWSARIVTAIVLIIGFALYTWIRPFINNFSDILYSCWAMQIGLFPVLLSLLLGWKINKWTALLSVLAGIIFALLPNFLTSFDPYSHSPIFALVGSAFVIFLEYVSNRIITRMAKN